MKRGTEPQRLSQASSCRPHIPILLLTIQVWPVNPTCPHTCHSLILALAELTNATFLSQARPHPHLAECFYLQTAHLASPTLNRPGQLAPHFLGKATPTEVFEVPVPLRALALGGGGGRSSQAGTWQREGADKLPSKLQMQQLKRGQRQ